MVADELRRQADEFVELAHLIPKIGRDPSDRPASGPAKRHRPRSDRPVPSPGLERRYGIRQTQGDDLDV